MCQRTEIACCIAGCVIVLASIRPVAAQETPKNARDWVVVTAESAEVKVEQDVAAIVTRGQRLQVTERNDDWLWVEIHGAKGWIEKARTATSAASDGTADEAAKRKGDQVAEFLEASAGPGTWAKIGRAKGEAKTEFAMYDYLRWYQLHLDASLVKRRFGQPDVIIKNANDMVPPPPPDPDRPQKATRPKNERWYYGSIAFWVAPSGQISGYVLWDVLDPPVNW